MSTVRTNNVQVGQSLTATNNFTLYQPTVPDGTVRLGVGNTGATTLDAVTVNSAGNVAVPSLTVNSNNISAVNSLGFRNRIINGDMRIDQRNAGASVTAPADGYALDRWKTYASGGGVMTVQRSTTVPTGFTNSQFFTVTTADSSLAGTDAYGVQQMPEGFNVADLGWGTAAAQTVTVSFWVRSSVTGTYTLSIRNSAENRSYLATYTVSAANTFEYKTLTIPGDTSGTWLTDNGVGLRVWFDLGAGATYTGAAGSWTGSLLTHATGGTNWISTNGATFYITGVQLEAGTVASAFERRDYGRELIMCQRYYQQWGGNSGNERLAVGFNFNSTQCRVAMPLVVTMRATPTLTVSANSDWAVEASNGAFTCSSIVLDQPSPRIGACNFIVASGLTVGQAAQIMANSTTNSRFNLSAEL